MLVEARKYQGQYRILIRGTRRLARYRDGRPIEPYTSFMKARWRADAINAAIRRRARRA